MSDLIVLNKLPASIHLFVAERPGWVLAEKFFEDAEFATALKAVGDAAVAFEGALTAAAAVAPIALPIVSEWTLIDMLTVTNSARQAGAALLKTVVNSGVLLEAGSLLLEKVPKVMIEIKPQTTKNILQQSTLDSIFKLEVVTELVLHAQTVVLTIYDDSNGRMLHFYTSHTANWTIDENGATNQNGFNIPWDGVSVASMRPTFVSNRDTESPALVWSNPYFYGAQTVSVLKYSTWRTETVIPPVLAYTWVGAAYYQKQLFVGYGLSEPIGVERTFEVRFSAGDFSTWNKTGSLWDDEDLIIDVSGVALAASDTDGMDAVFVRNDNAVLHVRYDSSAPSGTFGNTGFVYSPTNKRQSTTCPALIWYHGVLYMVVQEPEGLYIFTLDPNNSVATPYDGGDNFIENASMPVLLSDGTLLRIAYNKDDKTWIDVLPLGTVEPFELLSPAPPYGVTMAAYGEYFLLAWTESNGRITLKYYSDSFGVQSFPFQLPNFIDPAAPINALGS